MTAEHTAAFAYIVALLGAPSMALAMIAWGKSVPAFAFAAILIILWVPIVCAAAPVLGELLAR